MRTAEKLTSLSLLLIGIVFLLLARMTMVHSDISFLAFSILLFITGLISLLAGGANLIHRK
jgi:hypothetical protein